MKQSKSKHKIAIYCGPVKNAHNFINQSTKVIQYEHLIFIFLFDPQLKNVVILCDFWQVWVCSYHITASFVTMMSIGVPMGHVMSFFLCFRIPIFVKKKKQKKVLYLKMEVLCKSHHRSLMSNNSQIKTIFVFSFQTPTISIIRFFFHPKTECSN